MGEVKYGDFQQRQPAPEVGGPGNGGGPTMEARIARLESDVGHIQKDIGDIKTDIRDARKDMREDFRILFGALIFAALGLAAMMAHGFKWL